jgi:hypothetical protein
MHAEYFVFIDSSNGIPAMKNPDVLRILFPDFLAEKYIAEKT